MSNTSADLRLSENFLVLERDPDQLLLVDPLLLKPLYIKEGRSYVKQYLAAVQDHGTAEKMAEAFPQDSDLLDMLVEHRIVTVGERPERDALNPCTHCETAESIQSDESISLYLLLSQSCNLGCVYCLNGTRTYKKDTNLRMSEEVALRSVERCLNKLDPGGKLEIVFFGGEPLLNWPLAKKVISHCECNLKPRYDDRHIQYHITSNLTFLPKDLVEWARQYGVTFLCDVDGTSSVHDKCRPAKNGKSSHASTAKNIERLVKEGFPVSLRSTITSLNQDCMLDIARHHKAIGGAGTAFVPVNPVNSDEDILADHLLPSVDKIIDGITQVYESKVWSRNELFPCNIYASNLKMGYRNVRGCGAPYGNIIVVDANGETYPCIYLVGMKRFHLGNILSEHFPDKAVLDRMMADLSVDNMEECKDCNWRYLCGGSCAVSKLTVFDNPMASDNAVKYAHRIRCDFTKKIIELLLWDLAEEAAGAAQENAAAMAPC